MSQFSTRSSPAPSNTQRWRRSLFAPSSRHMIQSSRRMDWTQIAINRTCASCLDWVTRRTQAFHCTKASNCCLGSWEFRLNSTLKKTEFKISQETLLSTGLDLRILQYLDSGLGSGEYQDAHPSIRCLMWRMGVLGQVDLGQCRELLRHGFRTAKIHYSNRVHRVWQPQGRLGESRSTIHRHSPALYGKIEAG